VGAPRARRRPRARRPRRDALGGRTNTILQTCFFALSDVLPRDEALARIRTATEKTYRSKGDEVSGTHPAEAEHPMKLAEEAVGRRWSKYEELARVET
jgi:hypothetical protein